MPAAGIGKTHPTSGTRTRSPLVRCLNLLEFFCVLVLHPGKLDCGELKPMRLLCQDRMPRRKHTGNWNSLKFSRVFSLYPGKSVCWELESARRLCQDLLSQHKRSQKLLILLSRRPEVVGEHVYAKSTVMYRSACCNALRADPESKCTVK